MSMRIANEAANVINIIVTRFSNISTVAASVAGVAVTSEIEQ